MESINWYGTYCLTVREVKRFLRVYHQTIFTPVVSALIFLAVFVLAVGKNHADIAGIKFVNFMGYGLIIMSIVQNAFANSSSSFIMGKILGYIIDILTPPLGAIEIITAYTVGAIVRGVLVGVAVTIALSPFVDYYVYHPFTLIYFVLFSCALLGQLGIIAGMIANSFDQFSAFTSYIITPLSFLSGTFYSVKDLPEFVQIINLFNPFFYMIDGFRYSLTDHVDGNIEFGMIALFVSNVLVFMLLVRLLNIGWRIKS
jgi:ABC-2 type transport system permease protein